MILARERFATGKRASPTSIWGLLRQFGESEYSDPRDRIFPLLGLCKEGTRGVVKVDYT